MRESNAIHAHLVLRQLRKKSGFIWIPLLLLVEDRQKRPNFDAVVAARRSCSSGRQRTTEKRRRQGVVVQMHDPGRLHAHNFGQIVILGHLNVLLHRRFGVVRGSDFSICASQLHLLVVTERCVTSQINGIVHQNR